MPLVNVKDFGVVKFPDDMSPDDIKSALDKKYAQPAPFRGALAGVEEFAGSIPKGLASISEGAVPVDVPAPIWNGEINNGAPMAFDSGGRSAVIPPQIGESVRPRTGSEVVAALKENPLYKIGQTASESVPLTDQQRASRWTQGGEMVGGSAGMALGPLAVPAFTISAMGNTADDFERIKQENPKLTEDQAADQALQQSVNKGLITAATFSVLPPALRGALEKHLVDKMGNKWIAGRLASAAESGTVMGAQAAGTDLAEGKNPIKDTAENTGGGAIMGLLLPWLRNVNKGGRVTPNESNKSGIPGGTGGRGGQPDRIIQAARDVSSALRKGDAGDLQHALSSAGLDSEELRGLHSLLSPEEQSAMEAIGTNPLRGRSLSDASQNAIAIFNNQKGAGGGSNKVSGNQGEGKPGQEAGGAEAGIGSAADIVGQVELSKQEGKLRATTPYKLESDEGGGYSITAPDGSVVSSHASYSEAKLAMDSLKVSGGRVPTGTPLEQATAAAKSVGYELRPAEQIGAVKLEGLTDDQRKALEAVSPKQWEFTDPKTGVTTYMPEGSTPEQIVEHLNQKNKVVAAGDAAHAEAELSPEDQAHLDAERGTVQHPVEVANLSDPSNPFARNKDSESGIATIVRPKMGPDGKLIPGKILINPKAFSAEMAATAPKDRALKTRSILAQEQNHLATPDAAAKTYWSNLTAAEKKIFKHIYSGGVEIPGMNDELWGQEALSYTLNDLAKMTQHEMLSATRGERFKLKTLFILNTAIRGIRETLGTKASKENLAILGAIQENINLGIAAQSGSTPAAMSKVAQKLAFNQADELEKDALLFERAGDKAGADEMRQMAKDLRQKTFDQSFQEPMARRRKESDDQMKMGDLLAGDKFAGMKLSAQGNQAALSKADKENFDRAQAESGQKNFPMARIKKKEESVFQDKFLLPESESQKVMGSGNQKVVKPGGEELPPVPEGERKTAVESGAKEYPTVQEALASGQKWLDDKVQEAVAGADMGKHVKLSEKEFADAVRAQNPNIQPGQLSEMWADSIYKKLSNASDEEIRALTMNVLVPKAGSLKESEHAPGELGGIKGGGRSEGRSGSIWAAMANKMLSFSKGAAEKPAQGVLFPGIDRPGGYKEKKFSERYKQPTVAPIDPKTGKPGIKPRDLNAEAADRQNIRDEKQIAKRRTVLISALYKKLAVPVEEKADVHRSDVTIDDIRYGGGKLINAVQDYSRGDDIPVERLNSELLDESKRRSDDPTTYTKRLTLIEDRRSGKTSLVSTYRRGEDAMLLDPLHPQGHHLPLPDMLRRYRVIGSILLDAPVQKFKKTWDTLGEYNDEFGKEAHQINDAHTSGTGQVETQTHYIGGRRHTQIAGENDGIPGTEVDEGQSGHLQGPFRSEIEAATGAGRGSADKSRATPITQAEGDALDQHVVESLGRVPDSPSDVRRVLDEMTVVKPKPAALSAIIKLAGEIERESGDRLTTDNLLDKLAENIYEDPDSAKAVARHAKAQAARNREIAPSSLPQREAPSGKELVNPISRRPPTDVRQENLPPGTPQPSFLHSPPVPEATTKPRTREIMSDNDLAHVEAMSKDPRFSSAPEIRQGKERLQAAEERKNRPMQRGNLLREKTPMAVNRKRLQEERDKAIGELATAKTRAANVFMRKDTDQAMAASLDAADTVANNFAENAQWSVRMPSSDEAKNAIGLKKNFHGKKEILEGAPAMLAAGSVKARYHYNPETMAEAERLMKDESYAKKESYLAHLKKDLAIKTNMGKDTPVMREELKSMQNEFDTLIQKKLLETGFLNQADATYYHDPEAKSKLDEYIVRVKQGIEAADRMVKDGNYWDKYRGRRWKRSNEKLLDTLDFAKAQWDNPELQDTAMWMRKELDRQFEMERNNGYSVQYDDNYMPGRYDGELFSQHGVLFAGIRVLGRQFRSAKVFPTIYHAAQVGPYIPASMDGSAMVASRVRQGMRSIMKNTWWNGLKHINDDVTGQPIAKVGKDFKGKITAPGTDYTHEFRTPSGDKIYVLDGFENIVHNLTAPDAITKNLVTRSMLEAGQFLKHSVLLGDIFHLGRVTYYAASILGRKTAYLPGWAATSIREEDIPRAVKSGIISQQTANFLNEKVAFRIGAKASMISRARLSHLYQRSGLNVGRIQDSIYKDLVRNIPGFGQYNRFLFDRYTRGMMMTSALREFDRLSKIDPQKDSREIVQESARDLNFYFGSIGRQGWIKSQTFQSLSRLAFLAPQWLEGLIRKEASVVRGLHSPVRAFTGRDTMFRGMGRGLVAMLALTQVANMITRGQPTWMNKEKDHKWDAEVGKNVWLSPLAVFNELTGDIVRLMETKPKAWDAIQQIGENKLGFYGRAAIVLATDKAPGGKYQTTTSGVLGEAAKQLFPTPISLGVGLQAGANKIVPSLVPPVNPQTMQQKLFSTTGLKTHVGMDAEQYTKQSAEKFKAANKITIPNIEYTDEPSYSQLRYLVKNGDLAGAAAMVKALKENNKTDRDIVDAMRIWVRRPFTGSLHSERLWLGGMTDEERAVYKDAVTQKMDEYRTFLDWYFHQPH